MNPKGKYVIQSRMHDYEKWDTWPAGRFDTPAEAKAWLTEHGHTDPTYWRVAEGYTVERFKAYKG